MLLTPLFVISLHLVLADNGSLKTTVAHESKHIIPMTPGLKILLERRYTMDYYKERDDYRADLPYKVPFSTAMQEPAIFSAIEGLSVFRTPIRRFYL